jgi:hypothetical protein
MTEKQRVELGALYKALCESSHAPFMAYMKATDKSHTVQLCYTVYESALGALMNVIDRELFNDTLTKLKEEEASAE